jgi:dolichol-phosphate mannosyltransferase
VTGPNFSGGPPEISVVVPLFDESETLDELHGRLRATLYGLGLDHEIVLVDDGSRDGTAERLDALREADPALVVLHLSRNFGHQAAVTAGLDHARGRAVVVLDGDLQDPPELIPRLVDLWREGNDVVYAVRRARKEGPLKRLGYFAFYRLLRAIGDLDIPLDSGDFCLMDRRVVAALRGMPERMRFVRGLRSYVGFRQIGLEYERDARRGGRPKYSYWALLRLAIDGLVSFSGYPLRLVAQLGLASAVAALGLIIWVLVDAFYNHTAPRGWASLIAVVLFIGSAQLVALGIIGEYVRLIFLEAKGRPTYVLREPPRRGPRVPVEADHVRAGA